MNFRHAAFNAFGSVDCEIDHPRYGWIPVTAAPDDPQTAGLFAAAAPEAQAYLPPPDPLPDPVAALAAARQHGLATMRAWIGAASLPLSDGVPIEEMLSWSVKEAAARAVLADHASPAQQQLIGAEAAMTGESLADLCALILAKAGAYHAAVGTIAGLRRAVEAGLAAALAAEDCAPLVAAEIARAEAALAG